MKKTLIIIAWISLSGSAYSNAQMKTIDAETTHTSFTAARSDNCPIKAICKKNIMPRVHTGISFKNYPVRLKKFENIAGKAGRTIHDLYPVTPAMNRARHIQTALYMPRFSVTGAVQNVNLVPHTEYFRLPDQDKVDGSGLNIRLTDKTWLNMDIDDYEGMPDPVNKNVPDMQDSVDTDNDLDISLSLFVTIR